MRVCEQALAFVRGSNRVERPSAHPGVGYWRRSALAPRATAARHVRCGPAALLDRDAHLKIQLPRERTGNRQDGTRNRGLRASASGRAILTPVETCAYTWKTCANYADPFCKQRCGAARGQGPPAWQAAHRAGQERPWSCGVSSSAKRRRCAALRRADPPSTALPLPAPTAMEHKVVLERTDLLQKPIRKEIERRKIEADRRRNITTDRG